MRKDHYRPIDVDWLEETGLLGNPVDPAPFSSAIGGTCLELYVGVVPLDDDRFSFELSDEDGDNGLCVKLVEVRGDVFDLCKALEIVLPAVS